MFGGTLDLLRSGLGAVPIRFGPVGDNDPSVKSIGTQQNKWPADCLRTHHALEPHTLWSGVVPIPCFPHSVNGGAQEHSVTRDRSVN